MNDKPAGWYYVSDGKLRYRDDYGWTDYYMDTSDPRARDWPPPEPKTLLQQLRSEGDAWASPPNPRRQRRAGALFFKGRHAK
ncbi:hypothetical protein GCM10009740_03000 [Terrabacter terrae]|uniref:DUF2510 domain-containing protein n=1 Tax=Terrabacter terrae TaxID=318434 RepID=A0ABP5F6I3_9MICO